MNIDWNIWYFKNGLKSFFISAAIIIKTNPIRGNIYDSTATNFSNNEGLL